MCAVIDVVHTGGNVSNDMVPLSETSSQESFKGFMKQLETFKQFESVLNTQVNNNNSNNCPSPEQFKSSTFRM